MDPMTERDPLFDRYHVARGAYLVLEARNPDQSPMPYTVALTHPSNTAVHAAAVELADARTAWLSDMGC